MEFLGGIFLRPCVGDLFETKVGRGSRVGVITVFTCKNPKDMGLSTRDE